MSAGEKRLSPTERALLLAEAALAASAGACETETAGAFLERALAPLGAQAGFAWLPSAKDSGLVFERRALRSCAALPGTVLNALAGAEMRPGAGLGGEAWRRGRSSAGPSAGRRAPWDQAAAGAGLAYSAALPVFHQGRVAAVLQFYARGGSAFTLSLLSRLDRLGPGLGALLAQKRREAEHQRSLLSNLHDDVGQTLAGLAMLAQAFHRASGREGRALVAKAAQLSRLANEATAKVRALADAMEPPSSN